MIRRKIKIKDLGTVVTGTTPPTKIQEYYGQEYNFIKPSYIDLDSRFFGESEVKLSQEAYEKYSSTFIPPYSTSVVTIGSIGEKICINKEISLTNQQINSVIPNKDEYDNMFVFYLLKHNLYKVKAANGGSSSGRENVNKSTFSNIEVEVPDLITQRKIGKILSSYDDLIENNLKRIKLLEESAELIYKEWFINLKFPGYEKCTIVDGVPECWNNEDLGDLIKIIKGKKPKDITDYKTEDRIPYLLVETLERKRMNYTNDVKVPISDRNELLMIMDGSRSGNIYRSIGGAIGSTLSSFKIVKNNISNEYLYYFIKYRENKIKQNNTGSAIPHANKNYINSMEITIPDEKILDKFTNIILNIHNQIDNLYDQNEKLKEARDILIPRLISGEIEV